MEQKDKEKKKKKKKQKTKLLLGCVTVPSSNDASYALPVVDSASATDATPTIAAAAALSDVDEKKAEKRRKKLAKIAARNEKKELKKREKLNKKLGKLGLVDGEDAAATATAAAVANAAVVNRVKKVKKNKKKGRNDVECGDEERTIASEMRTPIGDDSVVVVELPLEDPAGRPPGAETNSVLLDATANGDGATTRCGIMAMKRKKKRRKAEDETEEEAGSKKKKRKKEKKAEKEVDGEEGEKEVAADGSKTTTTTVLQTDQNVKSKEEEAERGVGDEEEEEEEENVRHNEKKKKKKKSKKEKRRQSVDSAASVDSNDVSSLMSTSARDDGDDDDDDKRFKKKSKKRDRAGLSSESAASRTENLGDDSAKSAFANSSAPVPPDRPSKKPKKSPKVLRDAESAAGNDVDASSKPAKNDLIAELKDKVKQRKKSSPIPTEKKKKKPAGGGDDGVFATPTKPSEATRGVGAPARVTMGQWGKVELGSTEKTQKFFRLLGGMKKQTGSPLSFRSSKGSDSTADGGTPEPEKAIMAMGKKDADILNDKLEEQFQKALGGMGKGKVGLGFSPQLDPANKKFHIDANASKSVKF